MKSTFSLEVEADPIVADHINLHKIKILWF